MIHIATIHYQTDKWIEIQLRYIKKYILEEYRIYAFLDGDAAKLKNKFFYACTESIQDHGHEIKLNILADIISFTANNNDILIFLDGDAFPIGNIMELVYDKIDTHKLLAIQRLENMGDIQPHPSFCVTKVGFWKEIEGDWKMGYKWRNNIGTVTDVGGNLLKILTEKQINWYQLHKTSQLGEHPLWFGIYANMIYHHGSGFRKGGIGRTLALNEGVIIRKKNSLIARLLNKIPNDLIVRIKWKLHPAKRMRKKIFMKWEKNFNEIYIRLNLEDETLFDKYR